MVTPLEAAETRLGDPYVYAATGPNAFDCSGLTQWAYGQAGIKIPRTSQEQAHAGTVISLSQAQPGDLLTFSYPGEVGNPAPNNHVAMYVGPNEEIEAPHQGEDVKYSGIDTSHLSAVVRIANGAGNGGASSTSTTGEVTDAGFNILDPFGLFGDASGAVASAGEAITESVLKAAGPLLLNFVTIAAAGFLIVGGLWRMTEPTREKADEAEQKAAPLIGAALL